MTYTEYLQMLRLEKAEQLLTDTDNTIEQIAEEVGYLQQRVFLSNLCRAKRLYTGSIQKKKTGKALKAFLSFFRNLFFRALCVPLPVSDLRHINTILMDVLLMLNQLIIHLLNQISTTVS